LKTLCDTLQAIYEGNLLKEDGTPYKNLSINLPPGFGKSFTAKLFSSWVLGKDNKTQIITASYNEDFASDFSKDVRGWIGEDANSPLEIGYSEIFPNSNLKKGDSAKMKWSLEGHYMNFRATSPKGSVTGMRGNIHIIDDLIKDAYEAMNENILQEKWSWWTDTFRSRLVQGGIRIVIATRWSVGDLTGKLIAMNPEDWYILKMPACINENTREMLCEDLCNWERYLEEKTFVSEPIFLANYQQQPIEVFGRLYNTLKTYTDIPRDDLKRPNFEKIIAYVDSADKGNDYLAAIVAGVYQKELFVLDVLYTKDDMSVTEKAVAQMLFDNNVNIAYIESNNGGTGFARAVERILKEKHDCKHITIKQFHQSKNKESRILSMSSYVEKLVYFPVTWGKKWTDFYISMNSFQRDFKKNKNDDAQDAITGLVEQIEFGKKPLRAVKSLY
jgi:predicted phage terminase large subunit-like protein